MLLIHGIYQFRPKRIAFRNDYCLSCAQPRRSAQFRTFDAAHLFWVPILPLGFRKRWICTACGHQPHVNPGTRRGFKWAGLFILILLGATSWAVTVESDTATMIWIMRVGAPLGSILVAAHLFRTRRDLSLSQRLKTIPTASDTTCPFCFAQLLTLTSQTSCPLCGVVRS